MSEENTNTTAAPEVKEVKEVIQVRIGNSTTAFPFEEASRKDRKTQEELSYFVPQLEDTDKDGKPFVSWTKIGLLAAAIGVVNFAKAVMRDVIVPACKEASADAFVTTKDEATGEEDVKFSVAKFASSLVSYFEPGASRRGGPTVNELRKLICDLMPELSAVAMNPNPTEADRNKGLQLIAKINEYNALIAKKSRTATKAKATKDANAKAKAAAPAKAA